MKRHAKKSVDALSRRLLTIQEIRLRSFGIDNLKDLYPNDEDFSAPYKVCKEFQNHFDSGYFDFTHQEGFLFKGGQLCVPRGSMRENLIQEKHNGSLSGHFGVNKTIELFRDTMISQK